MRVWPQAEIGGLNRWLNSCCDSILSSMSLFTQFIKACVLSLLLIAAFSRQSISQPPRILKAGTPQSVVLPGFRIAHCIERPGRLRIYKALSDTEGGRFVIEKAGKQVISWPAQSFVGETSDFEVLQADLNGDGRRELVIANHDSTSNGVGIDFWTIYIFPDPEFRRPQAPLIFSVEEYGALGTFIPEGDSILILTTRWSWSKDPQGKRGEGFYLIGQWWRYRSGELVPIIEKPPIARRFLFSFAHERGRTFGNRRAPYLWLKSRKAIIFNEDPLVSARQTEVKRGILQSVSAAPFTESGTTVKIEFKPGQGNLLTFRYSADNDDRGEETLEHLGHAASGRVYPDKYFPAAREKWLSGKHARLVTYGKGTEFYTPRVLWISP